MLSHTYEYVTTHIDMGKREKSLKIHEYQFHFAL